MATETDILILGRGLAGAALAESCRLRGLSVHVFDHKRDGNASMAAGGAVNPVVLRRDVPSWRAAELMSLTRAFYGNWEKHLGVHCWYSRPLVKIFPTPNEVKQWERAMAEPGTAPFIASRPETEIDEAPLNAPHGYGTVTDAGWLDIPVLLDAQRAELLSSRALTERDVDEKEIMTVPDGVRIGEVKGRWLVRCTGPFATDPGLVPVKGETLTVRIPNMHLTRMVHGSAGLLPLGEELFRVGATFKWTDVWEGPTEEARTWLLGKLATLVQGPIEVVGQNAGVRPTARDRRPLLGRTGPGTAVINGLGARGVMLAPWCAEHLLAHLFDGKELAPEVDHARFD
jgi:glycine/D-amino acid oxidase-like deaminating enzyme